MLNVDSASFPGYGLSGVLNLF